MGKLVPNAAKEAIAHAPAAADSDDDDDRRRGV